MFTSKRTTSLCRSLCLAMMPAHAMALGIADVELNSSLNQKLDAKIALTTATTEELTSLTVTIIPVYADGMASQSLQHELLKTETGTYLRITSEEVIKEPVLNFQLDLDWNSGQLVRDYSLLLDPPAQGN